MLRSLALSSALILGAGPALANTASPGSATYIMQVSSNLGCDSLNIELVSTTDDSRQHIKFGKNAFAAVDLPAGAYNFGEVACTSNNDEQRFDFLEGKVSSLNLSAGQAYYGGRIIFQEVEEADPNGTPENVDACTNIISNARGESDNSCLDGVGASTSAKVNKQIKVFLPAVSDEEVNKVRTAMSATKEQLVYLPLKA